MNKRVLDPYLREKFNQTLHGLVVSSRTLPQRRADAFSDGIAHAEHCIIPEIRDQCRDLQDRLTKIKDPDRGYFQATADQMSETEALELADIFLDMYHTVEGVFEESERSRESC